MQHPIPAATATATASWQLQLAAKDSCMSGHKDGGEMRLMGGGAEAGKGLAGTTHLRQMLSVDPEDNSACMKAPGRVQAQQLA